ncbi:hypothetical protein EBZ80_22020 [bacterium]|nr:hypothetical protein [bacterium]
MNPTVIFVLQCVAVLLVVAGVFYFLHKKISYQMGAIESLQFQILEQNKRIVHQENVLRQMFGVAPVAPPPSPSSFPQPSEPQEPSTEPFMDVGPMMSTLMGMIGSLTPRPSAATAVVSKTMEDDDEEELEEELSEELSELAGDKIKEGRIDEVAAAVTDTSADNS